MFIQAQEWIGNQIVPPDCAFVNASWMVHFLGRLVDLAASVAGGKGKGGTGGGAAGGTAADAVVRDAVAAARDSAAYRHPLHSRLAPRAAVPSADTNSELHKADAGASGRRANDLSKPDSGDSG